MKKLKINSTAFAGAEVLSRKELKNVMGGLYDNGGSGKCDDECTSDSDCGTTYPKCESFVTHDCTNLVKSCVKAS